MKKLLNIGLMFMLVVSLTTVVFAEDNEFLTTIDWNNRHHVEFYGELTGALAREYPDIAKTYSIGRSWRERDLWVVELSSRVKSEEEKAPIAIIGNIHGGEHESAETTAYTAWWLATNYGKDSTATEILDNYIIYVLPVMNPDGYEQSFVYPCRQNLRPTDHNGDGVPFGDPYKDVNGDGIIAEVYTGARDSDPKDRKFIGMESPDFDKNGIPGDDWIGSDIDLNRTFNYMWNRYDGITEIGAKYATRSGPSPASEPEVKVVQNFLIKHPVYALATLHTGIQCVLFPWCYSPEPTADHDFMETVSRDMAKAITKGTGRPFYFKQSYHDYPTTAELIDWAYGRLSIHSYTIEVYSGGPHGTGNIENYCTWGNELPPEDWIYMGRWQGLDDVWFLNTSRAKMTGQAPPDQAIMCEGVKDGLLVMIKSEPHGDGPIVPDYLEYY